VEELLPGGLAEDGLTDLGHFQLSRSAGLIGPYPLMADSALEAITLYLEETLTGAENLEDVSVLWGPPVGDNKPAEFVAIGMTPEGQSGEVEREWGPIGGQKMDEEFSLDIVVEAGGMHGEDMKTPFIRSVELANAVESAIRDDITLGDLLLLPARFVRRRGQYFRADKLRGHRVFQTLTGTARI
jgi:hypothetical protein